MIIIYTILSFTGWLLVSMALEYGWESYGQHHSITISKHELAKIFWLGLAVLSFSSGSIFFFPQIPALLAVAIPHLHLVNQSDHRVFPIQIVKCLGLLVKQAILALGSRIHEIYRPAHIKRRRS